MECGVFARGKPSPRGLHVPPGIGDVQIWPCRSRGLDIVYRPSTAEEGGALLHRPGAGPGGLHRSRTEAVVPPGTEHGHLCLDEELSHFGGELGSGRPPVPSPQGDSTGPTPARQAGQHASVPAPSTGPALPGPSGKPTPASPGVSAHEP
ncbi:hypothetical protein LV779_22050 [Streptomyces thinghirensis]|nr:hypothetical protein [Streptomyces thinghirensis]